MNLIEIGYHSALADLGLEKTAGKGNWLTRLFRGTPQGPGAAAMDDVERAAAGLRPRRRAPNARVNARAEDTFAGIQPKVPAATGTTAPASPAATKPTPQEASGGGLSGFIRRNPLTSVGLIGAGAGGLGYITGLGAPPPSQPMQEYDPQQQIPAGYQ